MSIIKDLKNTIFLSLNENDCVFFSENRFYQKYFIELIKKLSFRKKEIIYITQDEKDIVDIKNVKCFTIKNTLLRNILFKVIQARIIILTITDLGYHEIKKSKFVKKYIYIFHSPLSTNKSYTSTAFLNYDEIFCLGDYQYKELINLNIKKEKLKKIGYFYFDYLKKNMTIKKNQLNNIILIAPSWNYNKENFLSVYCNELIKNLVKNSNYSVIFRPHPEHFKRNKYEIDEIVFRNKNFKNFYLDDSDNNLSSLNNSNILITDNSGIFIEYLFVFHKPVIFFDKYEKIHNSNYKKTNIKNFEEIVKEEFCINYLNPDFRNIEDYILKSINKLNYKKETLENFIKKNFYNFGKASQEAEKII
jgi:hypothetical protein